MMSTQIDFETVEELEEKSEQSLPQALGLDPAYQPAILSPESGYSELVERWVDMKYPLNVTADGEHGIIEGRGIRHCRQYPDGSGVYESTAGTNLQAVRACDHTYIWNEPASRDPWPYEFDRHDEVDWFAAPFAFVGEVLTEQTNLDLHDDDNTALAWGRQNRPDMDESWVDGDMFMRGVRSVDLLPADHDEHGALIEHNNGIQLYIGVDSTAHDDREMFGFVTFDNGRGSGDAGVRAPTAADALDLLRPDEALGAEERQGEWFLVPTEEHGLSKIQKPGVGERPYGGSPLENHVPCEWRTGVAGNEFTQAVKEHLRSQGWEAEDTWDIGYTPQDIFDAMHEGEIPADDLDYETARGLAEGVYVRGSLRHRESDHQMVMVEEWRQARTHEEEVIVLDGDGQTTHGVQIHMD